MENSKINQSTILTLKIQYGEDLRRITFDGTFVTLETKIKEIFGVALMNLTWKDADGDLITLKNQADLEELLKVGNNGLQLLKLNLLTSGPAVQSEKPTNEAAETNPRRCHGKSRKYHRRWHRSSYSSANDSETGSSSSSSSDDENGKEQSSSTASTTLSLRAKRHLEKIDGRLARANARLERLKGKKCFDEKEFNRQLETLKGLDIPLNPFFQLYLAKQVIRSNKHKGMRHHGHGRRGCHWRAAFWNRDGLENAFGNLNLHSQSYFNPYQPQFAPYAPFYDQSHHFPGHRFLGYRFHGHHDQVQVHSHGHPHQKFGHCGSQGWKRWNQEMDGKTQQQLELLKQNGFPFGRFMARWLRRYNRGIEVMANQTNQPNPQLAKKLEEVAHLQFVPLAIKSFVVTKFEN